jgi:heterodisulfide reductase subunit A
VTDREPRGAGTGAGEGTGRTGLYFCRCGPNLGHVVRLETLEGTAWPSAADVATHSVLCSAEGRAWLAERIAARGLDRIVVAACSPREHEVTFRGVLAGAGRSPWNLQMVNLREQVEWIRGDPAAATERSRRLVAAALARVPLHRPLSQEEVEVAADVLVVGGGPAGLSAARTLAGKGRKVVIAERAFALGGLANRLDQVFAGPSAAPARGPDDPRGREGECASCFLEPVLDEVLHHDGVEVLTGAEVARVRGAAGRFEVELAVAPRGVDAAVCLGCGECAKACPAERPDPYAAGLSTARAAGLPYVGCLPHVSVVDAASCLRSRGEPCDRCATACPFGAIRLDELGAAPARRTVTVGAIVVATGLVPGEVPAVDGVVSTYALERMLHPDGPTGGVIRGAGGREPAAVLLAPDADDDGELATLEVLKLAALVRRRLPQARVVVAGDLDRVPQLRRRTRALADEGVTFAAGRLVPESVRRSGAALRITLVGPGAGIHEADLVVVHAAARPAPGQEGLARLLRLDLSDRGFVVGRGASPFEPTATRIAGVYVVGAAAGPRTIAEAIRDGAAAAGLVHASLVPGQRRPVEPLAVAIDEATCAGCGICVASCPFGAIRLGAFRRAVVEAVHCRGCGTCAAACPTGAASAQHFTRAQLEAEISALLGAGEDEETLLLRRGGA